MKMNDMSISVLFRW